MVVSEQNSLLALGLDAGVSARCPCSELSLCPIKDLVYLQFIVVCFLLAWARVCMRENLHPTTALAVGLTSSLEKATYAFLSVCMAKLVPTAALRA